MSSSIDKLTLELMCNKSSYKKFLSKNEPEKYNELQSHLSKIKKHYSKIIDITKNQLGEMKYTNELDDAFDNYVRICIKYIEMKELEQIPDYKLEKETEDEDVLFGGMDDNEDVNSNDIIRDRNMAINGFSYWGKSITKVGEPTVPPTTPSLKN